VAHELGHALGLPHAGGACGGEGVDWPPDNSGYIHGVGLNRNTPPPFEIEYPGDAPDTNRFGDHQYFDLMSYCNATESDAWISTNNWTTLLGALATGPPGQRRPAGEGSRMEPPQRAQHATSLHVVAYQSGGLTKIAGVSRAQGRINVNNLAGAPIAAAPTRVALQRLMIGLGLPSGLFNAIVDWVDADDRVSEPGGAEDSWYSGQTPSGLAANAPVRRAGELLAVRGADAAAIERLLPFVGAVDAPVTVNVNTAPPEVLAAVVGGLDAAGAATLVASRKASPFATVADFRARLPRPDLVVDDTMIGVSSDWFEVSIEARQGDTLARARALLKRTPAARTWPVVVWQVVE
jgi:hypothetical protein